MDKDLERRLDRIEAKVDKILQAQDPRTLAYGHAQKVLEDISGVKGQKVKTFADAKREDRDQLREDYADSRGADKAEIKVEG